MSLMKIPSQYLPVMPYLILGKAKAFLQYARVVFGAKEQLVAPGENDTIMHGELKIGDAVIMFSNATDTWKEKTAAMFLYVNDVKEVYDTALSHGSKSLEFPQQKEYGFTAGFEDPFGNHWFIVEPEKK
jgi:PhnB protein